MMTAVLNINFEPTSEHSSFKQAAMTAAQQCIGILHDILKLITITIK